MRFVVRMVSCRRPGSRPASSYAYSPEVLLSNENMQRTIAKFPTTQPIRLQPNEPARKAAVLVPLCVVNGKVSLLYTLRAANLKTHRGQVSFPGGMQDVHDLTLASTALRETEEELGISQKDIEIWGPGSLVVTRHEMSVLPVAGLITCDVNAEELPVNTDEVEEVFTVPIEVLCNKKNKRPHPFQCCRTPYPQNYHHNRWAPCHSKVFPPMISRFFQNQGNSPHVLLCDFFLS